MSLLNSDSGSTTRLPLDSTWGTGDAVPNSAPQQHGLTPEPTPTHAGASACIQKGRHGHMRLHVCHPTPVCRPQPPRASSVTPVTSRPPEPKAKPHVAPEPKASPRVSPRLHRKETLAAVWVDLMLTLQTR